MSTSNPAGIRALVTGQTGIEKTKFVDAVAAKLGDLSGVETDTAHIGPMMYKEDPNIPPGKILWMDRDRLAATRRSVFKDVIHGARPDRHLLVNTHATFRWHHGLFPALDPDQVRALGINRVVTVIDNVETIHARLNRRYPLLKQSLNDVLVWREEEMAAARIYSDCLCGPGKHFVIGRGRKDATISVLARVLHDPGQTIVYPSFPMTHVKNDATLLAEIDAFRAELASQLVCLDPGEVDEFELFRDSLEAKEKGQKTITVQVDGQPLELNVDDVIAIGPAICNQIVPRDLLLIDQSKLIVSLIPEMSGGHPALSSGVERELDYALTHGKEVVVIWKAKRMPSPFISSNANAVVGSVEEARKYLIERGHLKKAA